MPVVGATADDYRLRIIEPDDRGALLVGVRFRAAPKVTFVEVYARDFPLGSPLAIATVQEVIRRDFAVFTPRYLRESVAVDSDEENAIVTSAGATDFLTVAGSIADLQGRPNPAHAEHLQLAPMTSPDYYAAYRAEHEETARYPSLLCRLCEC